MRRFLLWFFLLCPTRHHRHSATPHTHTHTHTYIHNIHNIHNIHMLRSASYLTAVVTVAAVTALCVRNLSALDFGATEEQDADTEQTS